MGSGNGNGKDDNCTLDQYLKYQVADAERRIYATCQKDFVLRRNLLYLKVTPKRSNEEVLAFVVPGLKRQAAIDGCHRYLGHQGRDHMLSLLRERFWWPGMAQRMMMSIRSCPKCQIFEAKPQIPPLQPILCMEPLDLVHIDYVSMEVTVGVKEKPLIKKHPGRGRSLHALHPSIHHQQPHGVHHGACALQ